MDIHTDVKQEKKLRNTYCTYSGESYKEIWAEHQHMQQGQRVQAVCVCYETAQCIYSIQFCKGD